MRRRGTDRLLLLEVEEGEAAHKIGVLTSLRARSKSRSGAGLELMHGRLNERPYTRPRILPPRGRPWDNDAVARG